MIYIYILKDIMHFGYIKEYKRNVYIYIYENIFYLKMLIILFINLYFSCI